MFIFEFLLILFSTIPSVLVSILSYKKYMFEKGKYYSSFKPFQFLWAKSFFFMSSSFVFTLFYMLIFNYIDPFSNSLLRFDFVVAIKLFETFSIFEFVRIGYHINSASKGKKYIDKRNQFLIDVVSISAVSLAPFFIVLNSYDDFFKVNSLLLHSQVTGYKYFDAIIVLVHIVGFFIILKEIGPRNKMEQYQARIIKSASMFALFQKILQIINIIFFNYTILLFVYIEWFPTLFSAWTILYYMFKDSNKEGY